MLQSKKFPSTQILRRSVLRRPVMSLAKRRHVVVVIAVAIVVAMIFATRSPPVLSHEKLDVYQKSIQFLALSDKLINSLPKGQSTLVGQLRRAALSVPLNIAEASGRTGSADNANRFGIARGSALECGAILDACRVLNIADGTLLEEGKALVTSVVAMLSKLSRPRT